MILGQGLKIKDWGVRTVGILLDDLIEGFMYSHGEGELLTIPIGCGDMPQDMPV